MTQEVSSSQGGLRVWGLGWFRFRNLGLGMWRFAIWSLSQGRSLLSGLEDCLNDQQQILGSCAVNFA